MRWRSDRMVGRVGETTPASGAAPGGSVSGCAPGATGSPAPDLGDRGSALWIVLAVVLVLGSTPDNSVGSTRSDRSASPVVET